MWLHVILNLIKGASEATTITPEVMEFDSYIDKTNSFDSYIDKTLSFDSYFKD